MEELDLRFKKLGKVYWLTMSEEKISWRSARVPQKSKGNLGDAPTH